MHRPTTRLLISRKFKFICEARECSFSMQNIPHIHTKTVEDNRINNRIPVIQRATRKLLLIRESPMAPGVSRRFLSYDSKYRSHLQESIFELYRDEATDKLFIPRFFRQLVEAGIRKDDPRLEQMIKQVKDAEQVEDDTVFDSQHLYLDRETFKNASSDEATEEKKTTGVTFEQRTIDGLYLTREQFMGCVGNSIGVIGKALKKQLVIPDWPAFTGALTDIFEDCKQHNEGKLAEYIPQLKRANPNSWAVSVCTIDGQRKSWGDAFKPFCLQSVSKPFTYALVHDELGPDELHSYIGQEPSGRLFNDISLDHDRSTPTSKEDEKKENQKKRRKKPHNPLINAGAIMAASLMKRQASLSDRFDFALRQLRRFCGNGYIGFNNAVFLSERETADRNYALAYFMREHDCFPPNTNLQDTLDLYFQLCSIETNCDTMSVMAATLANGGVNPMNGERIVNNRACRDTLSLMYSCGMYDWSGQFAFHVGLPAKSGVSGDMIIVIPNVMGIAIYSPKLDDLGNTVRGVKFAEAMVRKFNFHNYDSLVYSDCHKIDPRKAVVEHEQDSVSKFMFAAKLGDISAIKRYLLMGMNIHERDYDDRSVLHIAASEGDSGCLEYLLSKWKESPDPLDRFRHTPLEDATRFGHKDCVTLLQNAADKWRVAESD